MSGNMLCSSGRRMKEFLCTWMVISINHMKHSVNKPGLYHSDKVSRFEIVQNTVGPRHGHAQFTINSLAFFDEHLSKADAFRECIYYWGNGKLWSEYVGCNARCGSIQFLLRESPKLWRISTEDSTDLRDQLLNSFRPILKCFCDLHFSGLCVFKLLC